MCKCYHFAVPSQCDHLGFDIVLDSSGPGQTPLPLSSQKFIIKINISAIEITSSAQKMGSLWSREESRQPQAAPPQESQDHPPFFIAPHLDQYHQYKLVIVGHPNTGKTSLMNRFTTGKSDASNDTCIHHTIQLDGTNIELQVWTTGRTHHWHALTRAYYRGSVGIIITYSATDEGSFEDVLFYIDEVKQYAHPDTRLALVGTKCDCTEDKVVEYHRARDFASERQIPFFEVSNKDGTNVELAFMTLVTEIRQLEISLETSASSQYKK